MKKYNTLDDMIPELFSPSDILIFWGKRGKGKSSLSGKFMAEFMNKRNARKDVRMCTSICDKLAEAGYHFHPPTDHCVFTNTFFEKKGYLQTHTAYAFNPVEFALPNEKHPTGVIVPCGKYVIDEAQDLLDSHLGALPTFITKNFELSRQLNLFIILIAQRPMRIHKDIRELATFVEVVGMKNKYNRYGRLVSTTWECNIIYDNANLEAYLQCKKHSLIDQHVQIIYEGNIFKCYDSDYFLPIYFKNKENEDIQLEKCQRTAFTPNGFADFNINHNIDIPDTYRGKGARK